VLPWREIVKLVAIAGLQGLVIGLSLGASVWLFLAVSIEYPTTTSELDRAGPVFALSRLILPLPDHSQRECIM